MSTGVKLPAFLFCPAAYDGFLQAACVSAARLRDKRDEYPPMAAVTSSSPSTPVVGPPRIRDKNRRYRHISERREGVYFFLLLSLSLARSLVGLRPREHVGHAAVHLRRLVRVREPPVPARRRLIREANGGGKYAAVLRERA